MSLVPTSSQTVGPFFSIGLGRLCNENIVAGEIAGEHVAIEGRIIDGDGTPVPDAVLEIWQADAHGVYPSNGNGGEESPAATGFRGFGRVATSEDGRFRFVSIKPGCMKDREGREQAPHLLVSIFMRGLLTRLMTRIYFPDEPRNANDLVLGLVPVERRDTLIAKTADRAAGRFEWNVIWQGPDETVFFEW
jgi:protocatechuate 3,4-dioxygenase, alpha subunit